MIPFLKVEQVAPELIKPGLSVFCDCGFCEGREFYYVENDFNGSILVKNKVGAFVSIHKVYVQVKIEIEGFEI